MHAQDFGLGTPLCNCGAVGTFVRAAANMGCGDMLLPLKEPGFFLVALFKCVLKSFPALAFS